MQVSSGEYSASSARVGWLTLASCTRLVSLRVSTLVAVSAKPRVPVRNWANTSPFTTSVRALTDVCRKVASRSGAASFRFWASVCMPPMSCVMFGRSGFSPDR